MAVYIRLNGQKVDAEDLSPHERQQLVDAYRKRLKGLSGIEASKLRRITLEVAAINSRLAQERKLKKAEQKAASIKKLSTGFVEDNKIGRYAGGQGRAYFVSGGIPGSKR